MNRNVRHPVICVSLCTIILVICAGCTSDPNPRMFSTNQDYKFGILSTGPLTNVTFYIPLPVKNGTPMAGTVLLTRKYYEQENISIDFVQSPPGMNKNWTSPLKDVKPWFLKIRADRFYPNKTNNLEYMFFFENRTSLDTPLAFPDTIYPIGNESVFLQKVNFSPSSPEVIASKDPDLTEFKPVDVRQKVLLYADYSASPSTSVSIYSQMIVLNRWKHHEDTVENFYVDSYSWFHTGDAHGWQIAKGLYGAAEGPYPNLSSPVWQKVLNQGART